MKSPRLADFSSPDYPSCCAAFGEVPRSPMYRAWIGLRGTHRDVPTADPAPSRPGTQLAATARAGGHRSAEIGLPPAAAGRGQGAQFSMAPLNAALAVAAPPDSVTACAT